MPNKSKNSQETNAQIHQLDRAAPYYENQARITSTLLAALLALLTFLLVVGVQNSIKGFSGPLYVAIVTLGASLVLYALGYIAREYYYATLKNDRTVWAGRVLTGIRVLQQLVFIASIGAVVWFAISYAKLLLNPKPAPQQQAPPTSSQQQGAPAQGDPGPAPGETPEQHAKEQQQQQQSQQQAQPQP